jgi:hypothetical protein
MGCILWTGRRGIEWLTSTLRLARPVGDTGRVDAVDVSPEMIVHLEMQIDRDDLVREMERNGLRLEAVHTFLPYQYFLVFQVK